MDILPRGSHAVGAVAKVILHITTAHLQLRIDVIKFAEDLRWALAHDVCQHIQSPAMRHRQHDQISPLTSSSFDRHIEQWNETLGTFERKAFGPNVFLLNELFKNNGVAQSFKNSDLFGP